MENKDLIKLYKDAYGNDPCRKEGYYNNTTKEYITYTEYASCILQGKNMSQYVEVYADDVIYAILSRMREQPGYIEIYKREKGKVVAAVLGYSSTSPMLKSVLEVPDDVYTKVAVPTGTYLAELFVDAACQGRGYGTELLQEYIETCKSTYDNIITMTTTLKKNPQQMFFNNGFKTVYDFPTTDPWARRIYQLLLTK